MQSIHPFASVNVLLLFSLRGMILLSNRLKKVRIVLMGTTHSGNLGQTARAMKNMGLHDLVLVDPRAQINAQAISMASGADDLLQHVRVEPDLASAIADCNLVFGTSARSRQLPWPGLSPREMAAEMIKQESSGSIAVIFGPEHSGMTNEALSLCHYHVHIPTDESFSSLNLSQAVQVIVYEIMASWQVHAESPLPLNVDDEAMARSEQLQALMNMMTQLMVQSGFLDPKQPKKLLFRLRRLFMRAKLRETEVNILLGFFSSLAQLSVNE